MGQEGEHRVGTASNVRCRTVLEMVRRCTILYGCKSLTMQARPMSVEMTSCRDEISQRWGAEVTWIEQLRNEEVRETRAGMFSNMVQMEKLTETDNWRVKKLYKGEMGGKQPRGRPCKRWTNNLLISRTAFFIFIAAQDTYISAVGNPCEWHCFVKWIITDFAIHWKA